NRQSDLPTAGSASQYPGVNLQVNYTEKLLVGYRWYDAKSIAPAFCFGRGLSYTAFAYGSLKVTRTVSGARVTFRVANTGSRAGAEVPQLYVGFPSSTGEPPKQLKGYTKVNLGPGKSTTVTFNLSRHDFSWWGSNGWQLTHGTYRMLVGSSSCDIRLTGST